MNTDLENFARQELKQGLSKLPDRCHLLFKRMYGHGDLEANINDVVNAMPVDTLDWAMQQVQKSLVIEAKARN